MFAYMGHMGKHCFRFGNWPCDTTSKKDKCNELMIQMSDIISPSEFFNLHSMTNSCEVIWLGHASVIVFPKELTGNIYISQMYHY